MGAYGDIRGKSGRKGDGFQGDVSKSAADKQLVAIFDVRQNRNSRTSGNNCNGPIRSSTEGHM